MQKEINSKKICIIYYLLLMLIPIYELINGGNYLDIMYLVVLIFSTIRIILL